MSVAAGAVSYVSHEERIVSLVRQIEESCSAGISAWQNFPELHRDIQDLEKFAFSFDDDESSASTLLEYLAPEAIAQLNKAYCAWETELEYRFARSVLKGQLNISDYLLYERFDELLRRELALVPAPPPERLLFIGSGPVPISAVHMHLQTGRPVDCIDRDPQAVEISRELLRSAGLDNAIRIFCDRGEQHDVSGYDLVLVALLAKPKRAILKNLRKLTKPGTHILCRTSVGLRRLVYEPTIDRDVHGFYIGNRQIAVGDQTISTLLLEAAQKAAETVDLRWLTEIDEQLASQITEVMNRVLQDENTIGFPGPIDEITARGLMRQLHEDVKTGKRHVLVAVKGSRIVGHLMLTPNQLPNCRHIVEISRGFIDPAFRGAGLSERAFHAVAAKCDKIDRELIWLDVREGTLAAMWWRHFGFTPFGLLDDYARVGNKSYKGVYMAQTVSNLKARLQQISRESRENTARNHQNFANGNGQSRELVNANGKSFKHGLAQDLNTGEL